MMSLAKKIPTSCIIFGLSILDYVYTSIGLQFNYIIETNTIIAFSHTRLIFILITFLALSYIEINNMYIKFLQIILWTYTLLIIYHNIIIIRYLTA